MRTPPPDGDPVQERRAGAIESILQELIRRTATLGLSGLVLTEEALRRALSDSVPQEWIQYLSRQSEETRSEVIDRLTHEVGEWLRGADPASVLASLLDQFEFQVRIDVSTHRKGPPRP